MNLIDEQKDIINYDGNIVVIAKPGSGKTWVLACKIGRYLEKLNDHHGVIAISYTNKASDELKTRALADNVNAKNSFFGTFHRFFLSEIIIPFGKHLFGISHKEICIKKKGDLDLYDAALFLTDRDIEYTDLTNSQVEVLSKLYSSGVVLLESVGALANYIFDSSLACQKYLRTRYKHIFVDEYQDSDLNRHNLFLKIVQLGLSGFAVGDLNQAIFDGKDSKFLAELGEQENFRFFPLEANHRSHPSIINYSNYLLKPETQLLPTETSQVLFFRIPGNERCIAFWIEQELENFKQQFKIQQNSEIAILTTSNRTALYIKESLSILARLWTSTPLDNHTDSWSLIFSNLLRFSLDRKFRFLGDVISFSKFNSLNRTIKKFLIDTRDGIEDVFQSPRFDIATAVQVFVALAEIVAPQNRNPIAIDSLRRVLSDEQYMSTFGPLKENELNVMTIHKSKCSEFDLVFHVDLYEWVFPKKIVEDGNFAQAKFANWAQDLNLHYVGVSRAKKACVLLSSTRRTNNDNELKQATNSEFLSLEGIASLRNSPENEETLALLY